MYTQQWPVLGAVDECFKDAWMEKPDVKFRSCVKVEVAAGLGLSVLMSLTVSVDVKQH